MMKVWERDGWWCILLVQATACAADVVAYYNEHPAEFSTMRSCFRILLCGVVMGLMHL